MAPDALVIVGELQRVRVEGKTAWAALVDGARYELFNYTGIWYNRAAVGRSLAEYLSTMGSGRWTWDPLTRHAYDIPEFGRSPLKVGPIDTYAAKFLPRIILTFAKRLPAVGKILRQLLNAPNPLRRLG